MQNQIDVWLTSDKPKRRIQAIETMRQHPNELTMRTLANLAKTDPDPSVRKAAIQLGQEIQLAKQPKQKKDVQARDEAEETLERAINVMIEGDIFFARKMARKAFQTFPGLRYYDHHREAAADIMKMEPHIAIEKLLDDKFNLAANQMSGGNQSAFMFAIRSYLYKEQASWLDIVLDIFIYIIAISLPLLIILLAGNALFTAGLLLMQNSPSTPDTQAAIVEVAKFAGFDGVVLSITATISFAIVVIIPFLITFTVQMIMTHVSAVWFLSGDGSFRNLMHRSLVPMISMTTFYWGLLVATPILYALGFDSLIEAGLIEVVSIIAFFAFLFWFINVIGAVYQMDMGGGCMALMFPYLAIFGCYCSIFFINFGRFIFG